MIFFNSSYLLGSTYENAISDISTLNFPIFKRSASGAKISKVSFAIFFCFSGESAESVLKLCNLSANLMINTRISDPVATKSRKRLSLVTGK